jgi:large subunit ribosomal protein L30e
MIKDLRTKLGNIMKTGKVVLGSKSVTTTLLTGSPKMVILSRNCPEKEREQITYYSKLANVTVETAEENSMDLGSNCSKPFPVSAIGILEEGDSGILSNKEE